MPDITGLVSCSKTLNLSCDEKGSGNLSHELEITYQAMRMTQKNRRNRTFFPSKTSCLDALYFCFIILPLN